MKERILVTGFSASGKSHVARHLARDLNLPYIECDDFGSQRGEEWWYDKTRFVRCLIQMSAYIATFPSDCIYEDFPWEFFNQVFLVQARPADILVRKQKRQQFEPQNSFIPIPKLEHIRKQQSYCVAAIRRVCSKKGKLLTIIRTDGCGSTGRGEKDVFLERDLDLFINDTPR